MTQRLWRAFGLFAVLFKRIPMMDAGSLVPSAVVLIAYPVMLLLWPEQPDLAFTTGFVLCLSLRYVRGWSMGPRAAVARRWGTVGLILCAVFLAARFPALCQHLPSVISAGYVLLFGFDALDGSHATARAYWPGKTYAPYLRELTQAMVLLHVILILFNETVIAVAGLHIWLVIFALLPIVQHVLTTALFRTVFWVAPDQKRHEP
jgi:hypothetical protein